MKERLKFHFMDPFQKWDYQLRKRFPWKLIVQLTSIILVTAQVLMGEERKDWGRGKGWVHGWGWSRGWDWGRGREGA